MNELKNVQNSEYNGEKLNHDIFVVDHKYTRVVIKMTTKNMAIMHRRIHNEDMKKQIWTMARMRVIIIMIDVAETVPNCQNHPRFAKIAKAMRSEA